jgi:DNA-binding protein HU-beta
LILSRKVTSEPGGEVWNNSKAVNPQGLMTIKIAGIHQWRSGNYGGSKVNKAELIDGVAEAAGLSKKDATAAVDAVFDSISRAVAKGDKVSLTGFGIFEKSDRAARTGRNPQTGAPVQIAATSVPKFRAGAEFKKKVSGK